MRNILPKTCGKKYKYFSKFNVMDVKSIKKNTQGDFRLS